MTYLLLPSSRLALYLAEKSQLRLLPIKAEETLTYKNGGKDLLAVSFLKTLSIYRSEQIQKMEKDKIPEPISTVQFNKKLQGLTHNNKQTLYVSDKFGDIYSINNTYQQKYLNSNLGIPSFLQHIKYKGKNYLAVGDQDTRMKLYNEDRMHEIVSFWFLIRRVPLQLVQPTEDTLVLLVKKQNQINLQMHEEMEEFVQLYQIKTAEINQADFPGKMFYVSNDKEQNLQCKYQTMTSASNGGIFLVKLFNTKVQIISFTSTGDQLEHSSTKNIQIEKGQWDYLFVQSISRQNKEALIIVYGKAVPFEESKPINLQELPFKKGQDKLECQLNQDEFVIVYQL